MIAHISTRNHPSTTRHRSFPPVTARSHPFPGAPQLARRLHDGYITFPGAPQLARRDVRGERNVALCQWAQGRRQQRQVGPVHQAEAQQTRAALTHVEKDARPRLQRGFYVDGQEGHRALQAARAAGRYARYDRYARYTVLSKPLELQVFDHDALAPDCLIADCPRGWLPDCLIA